MKKLFLILVSVALCGVAVAQQNNASEDKTQPLVVVKDANGKTYKVDDTNSINKESIEAVTVFKNKEACAEFKQYGDTSEGVIYIVLKATEPLIVAKDADGKTYKVDDMNSIDKNVIESVTVLKNKEACAEFKQYGDTSNGVIYINLK